MTENSLFWTTSGSGDGAASGYTATEWFDLWRAMFAGSTGADLGGVAPGYEDELEVSGSASPVSVAAGAGLVYGIPYFNDAAVSVVVPTPTSQNRIDRIVLRAVWASQTVRVSRVAGTEGAGTPPALTQSAGSTWDVGLATVLITPAGAVTVTDTREYLQIVAPDGITAAELADGAVGTAQIDDGAVTNAKLANMATARVKGRASGAGTGAPTELTAAQLVDILETADGSGSGLDADTVDGYHASAFAPSGHDHDASYAATGHNHDSTYAATAHNHDSTYAASSHNHDSTYAATGHNHDATYAASSHTHDTAQIADNAVTNAKLADMAAARVKGRASGAGTGDPTDLTATELREIVKTADGLGSGLDADTLDGHHASEFAVDDHDHDATYAASSHNHDTAYAASSHNHDATYAASSHNHDATYAASSHLHTGVYAASSHLHTGVYAASSHNHDSAYAASGHNHDTAYAASGHNHDTAYAASGHNHDATYAASSHNHDATYEPLAHSHDATDVSSGGLTAYRMLNMVQLSGTVTITVTGGQNMGTFSGLPAAAAGLYAYGYAIKTDYLYAGTVLYAGNSMVVYAPSTGNYYIFLTYITTS